jgi:hypothetical protein
MNAADSIRLIGLSHLLQPPLTLLLASRYGVDLRGAITPRTPLAAEVMTNMAFASVALPTALGCLLAGYPVDALHPGPARAFALLLATFWSWRLYRQLFALGPRWPAKGRAASLLNRLLTLIFVVQGPCLGSLILANL